MFHSCLTTYDPDVLCLQETKAHPEQVTSTCLYTPTSTGTEQIGGVTLARRLSQKLPPGRAPQYGCRAPRPRRPCAGGGVCHVLRGSVYVPNAKRDLSRLTDRQDWDACLLAYLKDLEQHNLWCVAAILTWHTPQSTSPAPRKTSRRTVSPPRNELVSSAFSMPASSIPFGIHIRTNRGSIPGGGNSAGHGNEISGGGLIICCSPPPCSPAWSPCRSCQRCMAPITALSP